MAREFREEDRDKPIVTSEGDRIGRVGSVNEGRATVDRSDDDDSITDEIKDMLGWGDDDDDERELSSEHVDTHSDDEVRLRRHS